jgi:hypothetical protein
MLSDISWLLKSGDVNDDDESRITESSLEVLRKGIAAL